MLVDVDVGADGRAALGQAVEGGPAGAAGDLVDRAVGVAGHPGLDGAEQVAGGVGDQVGGVGLVEVGVRLDRGREDQPAVELVDAGAVRRAGGSSVEWLDDGDPAAGRAARRPACRPAR